MGGKPRIIRGVLITLAALAVSAGCRNSERRDGFGVPEAPPPSGDPLFGEFYTTPSDDRRPGGFGLGAPLSDDRDPVPVREAPPAAAKAYPPTGDPLLRGSEVTNAAMAAGLSERRGRESDLRLEWPDGARRTPREPEESLDDADPGGVVLRAPADANRSFVGTDATGEEPSEPRGLGDERMIMEELKQLGALEMRLEPTEGGWHFSCVVPSKRNQLVQRRYAARDPDKVKAVEAVFDQITLELER